MKITGSGPVRTAPLRRQERAGKTTSTAFSGELRDGTSTRSVGGSTEAGAVAALLAAQEIGDFTDEQRKAVHHGEDILERLDELRHGLLIGAFPKDKLNGLLQTVRRQHGQFRDPRLQAILQEIELRAMVELAKLGQVAE